MRAGPIKVALFSCTYHEIDGVANTSRQFAAYAREHGYEFLLVHAGPRDEVAKEGSVTRIQLGRSRAKFPLDGHHEFDLLYLRHYSRMRQLLLDFAPNVIHITGPSDVGILGLLLGHRMSIPLAASWQTNLHQFARRRVSSLLASWPSGVSAKLAAAAEYGSFQGAVQFYKIPRLLFAPNRELVELLGKCTGRPCSLMSHSVNTEVFSPANRERSGGPFRIGYVGRLTAEKNVRLLAQIERDLVAMGQRDFQMVMIGRGAEEDWLRENMRDAEFLGWLAGGELSRAIADLDAFVFPSETDTFGLAVLEALASGVPAVVSACGGPKYTVEHGKSGYVASHFDEFAQRLENWMTQPALHEAMRLQARDRALSIGSWERIFDGMYRTYENFTQSAPQLEGMLLEDAGKIVNT